MDTHHIINHDITSKAIIDPYAHTTHNFGHDAFCGDVGVHVNPLPHTNIDVGVHGCIMPNPANPADHIITGPNFSGNPDPYININFGNF